MYIINPSENRIRSLAASSFCELGFGERRNLQEWLANEPGALGEELLIIQKEFDGFDDTRERLDLLALDKEGRLVIIENKLDDTGRDVVWQAIKYAAYCSTLNTAQIVDIFQSYLNRAHVHADARATISEFLCEPDPESLVLNHGSGQRIILVAANFRKEVTATALWLLANNITIQCFKVTPYRLKDEILLDVTKIIPTAEAEEFMIVVSKKENDEKAIQDVQLRTHRVRREFWSRLLAALVAAGLDRYQNIGPTRDNWISAGTGVGGCHFTMIFVKDHIRVEMNMERFEARENKWLFDQLMLEKEQIEADFGAPLEWHRLDENKASRIKFSRTVDAFNQENWPEIVEWFVENNRQLDRAFGQRIRKLGSRIKQAN